ncbi:sulfite exporter TauE/SafE family protein [Mesobaculum littorinae]|uniref:Probable membrane transporter protein n=1 Tax=Mesobaculum littorinae TaxID=2486419 RepID=A0A438AJF5_9RHOB|nr:TSUP family transporter [Mesobaculum littorinae]RVV98784.1 sulfite exporter TauE/SafE family protein [Mesobaculum littorinae]
MSPGALVEALSGAAQAPGLGWLILAAVLGGIVRGFAGFGTALVYLPIAGQHLPPFAAISTMLVMDLVGPMPNVVAALRQARWPDVGRLAAGFVLALPLGVWLLGAVADETFRLGVSLLSILLLVCLASGAVYRGPMPGPAVMGVGAAGGFLGGAAGLAGPPVILFYVARALPVSVTRANLLIYLALSDIAMVALFWGGGLIAAQALWIGVLLILPYMLANLAGAAMFRPERERLYRGVAYAIVAGSAVSGLPFLD